jgi:hypothetical protein
MYANAGMHICHGELYRGGNCFFKDPLNHGELNRGGFKVGNTVHEC